MYQNIIVSAILLVIIYILYRKADKEILENKRILENQVNSLIKDGYNEKLKSFNDEKLIEEYKLVLAKKNDAKCKLLIEEFDLRNIDYKQLEEVA